ncbi:hypothetical protein MCZ04_18830, partial [Bacillus safensis]|nr:hypothetical protein [Bacillus safensis]
VCYLAAPNQALFCISWMENRFLAEIRQTKRLFFHECLFVLSQASKIVHEVKDKWNVYRK